MLIFLGKCDFWISNKLADVRYCCWNLKLGDIYVSEFKDFRKQCNITTIAPQLPHLANHFLLKKGNWIDIYKNIWIWKDYHTVKLLSGQIPVPWHNFLQWIGPVLIFTMFHYFQPQNQQSDEGNTHTGMLFQIRVLMKWWATYNH